MLSYCSKNFMFYPVYPVFFGLLTQFWRKLGILTQYLPSFEFSKLPSLVHTTVGTYIHIQKDIHTYNIQSFQIYIYIIQTQSLYIFCIFSITNLLHFFHLLSHCTMISRCSVPYNALHLSRTNRATVSVIAL